MNRISFTQVLVGAGAAMPLMFAFGTCSEPSARPKLRTIELADKPARELVEIRRLRSLGRSQDALSRCQTLLDKLRADSPQHRDVGHEMGRIYLDNGQADEAVAVFQELLGQVTEVGVRRVQVLHELGNAYFARAGRRGGRFAGAKPFRDDLDAALARQAESLESARELTDCPTGLVGRIHNSLGLAYMRQADYERAIRHLAEAEQLFRESEGTDARLGALTNLIQAMLAAAAYAEVESRCDELLALPGASANPQVLNTVGVAAMKLGKFADAALHFSVARTLARDHPTWGRDLNLTLELASNAAACAQEQGHFGDAETYLTGALRELGDARAAPRTSLVIRANLGRMYLTLGRLNDAERELNAVLKTQQELLGAEHPDALFTLLDLAALAQERARYGEAQELCERALGGLSAALGAEHPEPARARLLLASVLNNRNRCPEAVKQAREAVAIFDTRLGRYHKDSVDACLRALLIAAICSNTEPGAIAFDALYADTRPRVEQLRRALGPEHLAVLNARVLLADISARTPAAHAKALAIYRDAAEGFLKSLDDCHPALAKLRAGQGRLLVKMNRLDEAAQVYARALGCQSPWFGRHPLRAELLEGLGDVYQARGADARARRLHQQAYEILLVTYGREHPQIKQFAARHRG